MNCCKKKILNNFLQDYIILFFGRDLEKKGIFGYLNKYSLDVVRKVKVNLNEFEECVWQKGINMLWLNKLSQFKGKFYL